MRQQVMNHISFVAVDVRLHALKHTRVVANIVSADGFPRQSLTLLGWSSEFDTKDRQSAKFLTLDVNSRKCSFIIPFHQRGIQNSTNCYQLTYLSRKPASPIVNSAIGCAAWHKHSFSTMNALTTFH